MVKSYFKRLKTVSLKNDSDLSKISKHLEQKSFHPIAFFWLTQVETYLHYSKLTTQLKTSTTGWSKAEEKLFDLWSQSEYAKIFLSLVNKEEKIKIASNKTLLLFKEHLLGFATKHFKIKTKKAKYSSMFELGDFKQKSEIYFVDLGEKAIEFQTWDLVNAPKHLDKIVSSLSAIKTYSPASYARFKHFTRRIIPIAQKELVSYSLQQLPGYSYINLYHRDSIDLLDDLLHENGHHHLNVYLNQKNLIQEPQHPLYYSPWRRSPRPLRGIYHAYFTFFWAYQLYFDLAQAQLKNELNLTWKLNNTEKQKIYFRCVEEFLMLDYSFVDLMSPYKQGLINKTGLVLIQDLQKDLRIHKKLVLTFTKKLDKNHAKQIAELRKELSHQRHHFVSGH